MILHRINKGGQRQNTEGKKRKTRNDEKENEDSNTRPKKKRGIDLTHDSPQD